MPGLESSLHWSCVWIDWKDKGSSRYKVVLEDNLFSSEILLFYLTHPTII